MKLTLLKVISFLALMFISGATVSATDYYVDSNKGNDANSGHRPKSAWRSLDALNKATFKPGDRVLLAADSRYTGQLAHNGGRDFFGNPVSPEGPSCVGAHELLRSK